MILSLHNISTETQAPSRLAVLRRELVGGRSVAGQWHRAYRSSLSACGHLGLSATAVLAVACSPSLCLPRADPRANAKQEGTP